MRTIGRGAAMAALAVILAAPQAWAQGQAAEGYTFIRGLAGTEVCMGAWTPPAGGFPGRCEGQVVDLAQFMALSTRASTERLEQALLVLTAMDQRLALGNEQLRQLTEVTLKAQAAMDHQVRQANDLLLDVIARRFDQVPAEVLADEQFKEVLEKLRKDILAEVEKQYAKRPSTPAAPGK
jgi:hypothetical protein